ncbi:CAP domain-containing protein [Sphingomonas quercus]|uniref:SCP-like extracellular n=1 Tax=Sphingomonas quercus TaxID=2842451 RepID=A0ABS6BH79_9SPHN|nr:CAP domain-containing protein [Sphingomonas quercus]MBU3077655.1 SCP-like extracellular [Sphingomonas quercus]
MSALALPFLTAAIGAPTTLEDRLLLAHNVARRQLGLGPLVWDAALAADAAVWSRHLARVGYLVHSPSDPRDPDPQGENLWAGTKGYYSPEQMVGLWLSERRNYVGGIFPNVSRTGDLEDVGHYTQMVWRSSTTVGCAVVSGEHDQFLTCRYAEGGNVIGEQVF